MGANRKDGLQRVHEYYRALIENSVDLIIVLDAAAVITFIGPSIERILGYSPEEITGTSAYEYVRFEEIKEAKARFDFMMRNPGVNEHFECTLKHRDGRWLRVEAVGRNLLSNPKMGGVVINGRDVTDHRRMAKKLSLPEESFRVFADLVPETISLIGADGRVQFAGKPIAEVLGYAPEDLDGMSFTDLVHPDDQEGIIEKYLSLLERPGGKVSFTCRARHKDGRWLRVEGTGINHVDNLAVEGIVCASWDVTGKYEEREREERASRAFLENAGFELRQELTIVKGYASLLRDQRGRLDERTRDKIFREIEACSRRLEKMIEGLSGGPGSA